MCCTVLVCSNGDIRLVGSNSSSQGRVEVCVSNNWGTVCDNSWENVDAQVACRQAGFAFEGAIAMGGSAFGEGTGDIVLDGVTCVGIETRLVDCISRANTNCVHSQDAGVTCQACKYHT